MRRVLRWVADLFFPPVCAGCRTLLDWYGRGEHPTVFCQTCAAEWENERLETCGCCGLPVGACACMPEAIERAKCAAFRKLVYYHQGTKGKVQNRVLFGLKDRCMAQTAQFLAEQLLPALREMVEASGADPGDCRISYVPRSRRAIAEHGTDQAKCLATALAELSGIPLCHAIVRQRGANRAQKSLSPAARLQNAKRAFALAKGALVKGKTLFVVDDIVTTGASMAACAALLRRAGAARVYCMAVASDDVNRDPLPKRV